MFAVIISNVTIATMKDSRFCLIPFCNAQSRQSDEGGVLPEGEVVPVRIPEPTAGLVACPEPHSCQLSHDQSLVFLMPKHCSIMPVMSVSFGGSL